MIELIRKADGLVLTDGNLELTADFRTMLPRLKTGNMQREILVKAARIRNYGNTLPVAIDATAGLGEDSLLLAAAGFRVEMYERDPVIAALLEDALLRAADISELEQIAGRMHLHKEDSIPAMGKITDRPDVILMDPMFPERTKSASVKKKFQLLQKLEHPAEDEEALMQAAFSARPRKLVIKRPVKGPYLCGRKPEYTVSGKAIRYDCFTFAER